MLHTLRFSLQNAVYFIMLPFLVHVLYHFFFLWRCNPTRVLASSFLRFSRSHTTTHHNRYDTSGWVISSSQRPLPANTQNSQQTKIQAPGGIRNHDLSRRTAAELRLRPRGYWDRHIISYKETEFPFDKLGASQRRSGLPYTLHHPVGYFHIRTHWVGTESKAAFLLIA
jgi:hypothetical protein